MKKIKVSTFTDESGQDTKGKIFVACTIISLSKNSSVLEKDLIEIEQQSNKNNKWYKTSNQNRQKYVKKIIKYKSLSELQIYFSIFRNKSDYYNLLGSHIAKSIINSVGDNEYKAKIFIDKTNNAVLNQIKNEIKLYRIKYQKIRGLSDKSSSLIRLADSACGLIRDLNKNSQIDCYKKLFKKFKEV